MIELEVTDFVSLEEFALRSRFDTARNGAFSPELLTRLRPIRPERAGSLAFQARHRCEEAATFSVTFRSDSPPAVVSAELRTLPPPPSSTILVSWDARTALVSDWDVFVSHWDDFCYPASDDVTVWPTDGAWTLCYRHYEVFQFDSGPRAV